MRAARCPGADCKESTLELFLCGARQGVISPVAGGNAQGVFSTADAHHGPSAFAPMVFRQRYCPFAVDDASRIASLALGKVFDRRHLRRSARHSSRSTVPRVRYRQEAAKSGALDRICPIDSCERSWFPAGTGNHVMVEAGGQLIRGFRSGPDYAFIRASGCGACYAAESPSRAILVPAPSLRSQRAYESLQGRPEVGPLPTPRRHHAAVCDGAVRLHRCELRSQPTLTSRRDPRSNPRPQALDIRIYVRSPFIGSHVPLPEGQGRRHASDSDF